jgi:DNA-directed RNA polymerase specialized sigma24 family protein
VARLCSLHYRPLVRLATMLVRDAATAEKVVQDAFAAMRGGRHRLGMRRRPWRTCARPW